MAKILVVAHAPLATAFLAVAEHAYAQCAQRMAVVDVLPQQSPAEVEAQVRQAITRLLALPAPASLTGLAPVQSPPLPTDAAAAAAADADAGQEVLVLVDVFGATPCNAALAAAQDLPVRVVTGLSVPMLWRVLCYADQGVDDLVERAITGAALGAMQAKTAPRQNQNNPPPPNDPNEDSSQ